MTAGYDPPITFAKGYGELSAHPYGILQGVVDGQCFGKDSWGAAITYDFPMFSQPTKSADFIATLP